MMQFIKRLQFTVVQLTVKATREARTLYLLSVLPALKQALNWLRFSTVPDCIRFLKSCFSRFLPFLKTETVKFRNFIVHAYRKADHLMPGHHLAAAAGLALTTLSLIALIPYESDAHSGKTVINLTTGDSYSISSQTNNSEEKVENAFIAAIDAEAELEQILSMTEFSLQPESELNQVANNVIPSVATSLVPEPSSAIAPVSVIQDNRLMLEVESGDNLSLLFQRAGFTDRDVYQISRASDSNSILTNLYPGYTLAFDRTDDRLQALEIVASPLESYVFTLQGDDDYAMEHQVRTPEIRQAIKQASIQDSLFLASQRAGIPNALTMEVAAIFGGVIDFMLDTRKGDNFTIIYEEKFLDGAHIGTGQILAVQYTNQGTTHTALMYEDTLGDISYYNPQGESMRKAFLRNPVDFVRISSDFNPNRRHPILNTIRAHKGTDYAAPTGTPIVATADGKVTWASRNGSFGNLVVIDHDGSFETKYAHLNKYANGIKVGSRVKQGQTIGYVGSTGSATGPHLHYEFLMEGVHQNPRTIHNKLPKAQSIAESELPRFLSQTGSLMASIEEHAKIGVLASLDSQNLQ